MDKLLPPTTTTTLTAQGPDGFVAGKNHLPDIKKSLYVIFPKIIPVSHLPEIVPKLALWNWMLIARIERAYK